MSYIEENGNWAQSDVREVFETKGIIPSNANEAFAAKKKGTVTFFLKWDFLF